MDAESAGLKLLDTAERLFDERGVQAVGMDAIRSASGVSLKRLYQVFPSKDLLVEAVLRRRDEAVRSSLAAHGERVAQDPRGRALAVFDWLADWFAEPGFRGCAFINTFGELGGVTPAVAALARDHKAALRAYFAEQTDALGLPPVLADQLALLANGAMAVAGITGSAEPAAQAKDAAAVLLAAARP
ncbi:MULTISPECIES: TetR/AcrR family transcriptional regulator [unclassified Streptomyces]|uniref:TetR/AcrR family transcriptional regulator n=1 Tax=unclassified Streptomyces TaxID=2593676 RepID=UPI0006F92D5B|nr:MULTISPECIES: TetR/AcrR family transcriptional regulator [unclassified Streptomyces]KQX57820.1 TetR family transcriptional regulator [Streptomyces sp. Root1304]KRA78704.1 TetR family transcriptional regulator [Streptomyces sp. Root66D1]